MKCQMTDAFDLSQKKWTFKAVPSGLLASTTLPIQKSAYDDAALINHLEPLHNSAWWAE
jgi:hypothetical protein